jgi:hypothetical protein
MFDKAKMLSKALKIKKVIEAEVSVEEREGIRVEIRGDQKIKSVKVDGVEQKKLVDVMNRAMKKSQKLVAKKMQEMGGLGDLF